MEKISIEQGIKINGYHLSSVVGDSMMPLLRQGKDFVKVVSAPDKLKKYDIALFKRPTGEYVLHRVVKVKSDFYIICGDNRFFREKIPYNWIVGMAESVFIGKEEIKMTDERQIRYAKKVCRTFWIRRITTKLKRIFRKR